MLKFSRPFRVVGWRPFSACVKPVAAAISLSTWPQRHYYRRCVQERYASSHVSSSFYERGTCNEHPQLSSVAALDVRKRPQECRHIVDSRRRLSMFESRCRATARASRFLWGARRAASSPPMSGARRRMLDPPPPGSRAPAACPAAWSCSAPPSARGSPPARSGDRACKGRR
jgi:hypothetical protein